MSSGITTKYARVGTNADPFEVWWDPTDNSIHLTCNDKRLTDENGEKPGFRVVFNSNPRSADYNPATFNRLSRFLRDQDRPAPDEVPIKKRQLNLRQQVIAELAADAAGNPMGKAANPETMGWTMCPSCTAVVVDLNQHRAVSTVC